MLGTDARADGRAVRGAAGVVGNGKGADAEDLLVHAAVGGALERRVAGAVVEAVVGEDVGGVGDGGDVRVLGGGAAVVCKLGAGPLVHLAGQEGGLGAERDVAGVDVGGGELVLAKGGRVLGGGGGVVRLGRRHVVEVDRAEARLEEGLVELVGLAPRGKEGKVAVGQVGGEKGLLGLRGKGQVVCAGRLLGEAGRGVKGGGVGDGRLRGLSRHEAVGKGRVKGGVGGKLLLAGVEGQVNVGRVGRGRKLVWRGRVRLIYNRRLLLGGGRGLAGVLGLVHVGRRGRMSGAPLWTPGDVPEARGEKKSVPAYGEGGAG